MKTKTENLALLSIMVSLSVATRFAKHVLVGPIQFVNFPLYYTMLAAYVGGPALGAATGFLSYALSDVYLSAVAIGVGPWTIVTSTTACAVGALAGFLLKGGESDEVVLFVETYVLCFVYDVVSSFLCYLMFWSGDPAYALLLSIIGLFLPAGGGYMVAAGLITEASTSMLLAATAERVRRALEKIGIRS